MYPKTTKKPVLDSIFGTTVLDNYRWLEDDKSPETEAWVKAENEVTFGYLSKIQKIMACKTTVLFIEKNTVLMN